MFQWHAARMDTMLVPPNTSTRSNFHRCRGQDDESSLASTKLRCTSASFTCPCIRFTCPGRSSRSPIQLLPVDETAVSTLPVARCADGNGTLTPLFFSDHVLDIARAKAICAKCALAASCLSDALEREEPWGVWGGELLSGGRIVANKRPGGRPPTRPRPPVIVDEFGVVDLDEASTSS